MSSDSADSNFAAIRTDFRSSLRSIDLPFSEVRRVSMIGEVRSDGCFPLPIVSKIRVDEDGCKTTCENGDFYGCGFRLFFYS